MAEFPIGCSINGGEFVITEHLHGGCDRGIYRGRVDDTPDDQAVLVTLSTPQEDVFAAVFERLELTDIKGVSELLCINRLETDEVHCVAMVEVEPKGQPVASCASLTPPHAIALARQLAQVLSYVELLDEALLGLRPELIYVDADTLAFTKTAPRSTMFWSGTKPTCMGVPACFDIGYLAPELLAGKPADVQADVFSLCVMLAEWTSGEYPFTTPPPSPLLAPLLGERVPWTGSSELASLLKRGLERDPAKRLDVAELIDVLSALTE